MTTYLLCRVAQAVLVLWLMWLAIGLSIGILSARRPGSIRARGATLFIFSLVSTPTFVLGGVLLFIADDLLSSHGIHAFPFPGTWTPLHVNPLAWADNLALPWITLALVRPGSSGGIA